MAEPNWDLLPDELKAPVEKLRQAAGVRTVNAVVNGKGMRNWNMQQFGALFSGITAVTVVTTFVWAFNVYAEYRGALQTVKTLSESAPAVARSISDIATSIAVIHVTVADLERRVAVVEMGRPVPQPARPAFSRSEQFAPAAAEREETQP